MHSPLPQPERRTGRPARPALGRCWIPVCVAVLGLAATAAADARANAAVGIAGPSESTPTAASHDDAPNLRPIEAENAGTQGPTPDRDAAGGPSTRARAVIIALALGVAVIGLVGLVLLTLLRWASRPKPDAPGRRGGKRPHPSPWETAGARAVPGDPGHDRDKA